jgi:hypothetical protein
MEERRGGDERDAAGETVAGTNDGTNRHNGRRGQRLLLVRNSEYKL